MTLQKLPTVDLDNVNHRRGARERINQILDHSFDDSKAQTTIEKTNGRTPVNTAYPPGHVFRWMTDEQRNDVLGYTYAVNVRQAVQNAMDAAYEQQCECYLPGGGYLIGGTLVLPGEAALRYRHFRMRGEGMGEIFARTNSGGTVLLSTSDAPILQYTPDSANTGNGSATIELIRFDGDSSTPVVHFISFYAQSRFRDCSIFNGGIGDGLKCELSNTIEIDNVYSINGDWNTTSLGAARTSIAFNFTQSIDTGLTKIYKATGRGFLTAYSFAASGSSMYAPEIEHSECSVVRNGVIFGTGTRKASARHMYMEGGDGGDGLLNEGNYNSSSDCLIFAGFADCIDDSSTINIGSSHTANVLSAGTTAGTTLLRIASTAASGGPGKVASGNTFVFPGAGIAVFTGSISGTTLTSTGHSGASLAVGMTVTGAGVTANTDVVVQLTGTPGGAGTYQVSVSHGAMGPVAMTAGYTNVVAIRKSGTDPRFDLSSNIFDPRGGWTGGAGTTKVSDSSSGGEYGLTQVFDGAFEFPSLSRGQVTYGLGSVLADSSISGNVLTVPIENVHQLTCTGAQTVNQISAAQPLVRPLIIITTNANTTFANTASLIMAGGINYTPGANGASLTFINIASGIFREIGRTAY